MIITLTQNGLVLQSPDSSYLLDFASKSLSPVETDLDVSSALSHDPPDAAPSLSLSCLGVFGIFPIDVHSLAVITSQEEVAQLQDAPIYKITGALLIPLSYLRARAVMEQHSLLSEATESGSQQRTSAETTRSDGVESTDSSESRSSAAAAAAANATAAPAISPSTVKFSRECQRFLASGAFFYSSVNLHQSLNRGLLAPQTTPSSFYLNYHRNRQFAGTDLELKIIQGHVGHVSSDGCSVVLISRRSMNRIGARYLRRGIDDDANCANWVETEQLLVTPKYVLSYVIVRGSLPVFFQQSPYKLKPTPRLLRGAEATQDAFAQHFRNIESYYGPVTAVSLVEASQTSNEFQVGNLYRKLCAANDKPLEWFDFHHACKGMRFDRVVELFDSELVQRGVDGFLWNGLNLATGEATSVSQAGVFRVNCIDCLDRTNVVQTEIAKRVLEQQLEELGLGPEVMSSKYYHLWADNGDAISRQYSNTNALKGEFTRNRKRDFKGVLTDVGLTLTRFYSGMVSDFFRQALFDFLVGNVDERVFHEFDEKCSSSDPRMYSNSAIEVASEICQDDVIAGWWVEEPRTNDKVIVLLTDTSIYVCKFDFMTERVCDFEKVDVSGISGVLLSQSQLQILTPEKQIKLRIPRYNEQMDGKLREYCETRGLAVEEGVDEPETFVERMEKRLKRLIWA